MTRYAELGPQVRVVADLGFGYLDDGVRTHRLEIELLRQLLAECLTDRAADVLARYPTLFVPATGPESALRSFRSAGIGWPDR